MEIFGLQKDWSSHHHYQSDGKIKVVCLDPYEAWQFFKENVGEYTLLMHHEISGLAKEVAKECNLPLALVVIGRAMRNNGGLVERWRNALRTLKTSISMYSRG